MRLTCFLTVQITQGLLHFCNFRIKCIFFCLCGCGKSTALRPEIILKLQIGCGTVALEFQIFFCIQCKLFKLIVSLLIDVFRMRCQIIINQSLHRLRHKLTRACKILIFGCIINPFQFFIQIRFCQIRIIVE